MNVVTVTEAIDRFGVVFAPEDKPFTLANGSFSRFYIDLDLVMMVPHGAFAVINEIMQVISKEKIEFDLIGGPATGANAIVGGVLLRCKPNIRGFTIRKGPKGRGPGAGAMHDGYLEAGKRVILVEDVTTSGMSVYNAAKEVERLGAKVIKIITVLDRQAGAADLLKEYSFTALTTLNHLTLRRSRLRIKDGA